MEEKPRKRIEKNLEALLKKHTLSAKLFLDGTEVVEAEVKKDTIYLDSKNIIKLLTAPELVKLGLALRGASGGKYKVRMKKGMIMRVLGKE